MEHIVDDSIAINYRGSDRDNLLHILTHIDINKNKVDIKDYLAPNAHKILTSKFNAVFLSANCGINYIEGLSLDTRYDYFINNKKYCCTFIDSKYTIGSIAVLIEGRFGIALYTGYFCFYSDFCKSPFLMPIVQKRSSLTTLYLDGRYYEQASDFCGIDENLQMVVKLINNNPTKKVYIIADRLTMDPIICELARNLNENLYVDSSRMENMKLLNCENYFTTDASSARIFIGKGFLQKKGISDLTLIFHRCPDLGGYNYHENIKFEKYKCDRNERSHHFFFYPHSNHKELCKIINALKPENLVFLEPPLIDTANIIFTPLPVMPLLNGNVAEGISLLPNTTDGNSKVKHIPKNNVSQNNYIIKTDNNKLSTNEQDSVSMLDVSKKNIKEIRKRKLKEIAMRQKLANDVSPSNDSEKPSVGETPKKKVKVRKPIEINSSFDLSATTSNFSDLSNLQKDTKPGSNYIDLSATTSDFSDLSNLQNDTKSGSNYIDLSATTSNFSDLSNLPICIKSGSNYIDLSATTSDFSGDLSHLPKYTKFGSSSFDLSGTTSDLSGDLPKCTKLKKIGKRKLKEIAIRHKLPDNASPSNDPEKSSVEESTITEDKVHKPLEIKSSFDLSATISNFSRDLSNLPKYTKSGSILPTPLKTQKKYVEITRKVLPALLPINNFCPKINNRTNPLWTNRPIYDIPNLSNENIIKKKRILHISKETPVCSTHVNCCVGNTKEICSEHNYYLQKKIIKPYNCASVKIDQTTDNVASASHRKMECIDNTLKKIVKEVNDTDKLSLLEEADNVGNLLNTIKKESKPIEKHTDTQYFAQKLESKHPKLSINKYADIDATKGVEYSSSSQCKSSETTSLAAYNASSPSPVIYEKLLKKHKICTCYIELNPQMINVRHFYSPHLNCFLPKYYGFSRTDMRQRQNYMFSSKYLQLIRTMNEGLKKLNNE